MKNTCMIAFVAAFTVNLFVSCAPRGAGKAAFPGTGAGSDSGSSAQTTLVSSGTSDRGGGGRGVLCKRDGKSTVELLDLYEAKSMYGLHLIDAPADETSAIKLFAQLLARQLWTPGDDTIESRVAFFHESWRSKLMGKVHFLERTQHLKLSTDAHEPILEDGCSSVQVALYYDENSLMIDSTLWKQMDWLNRAALMTHEFVYKVARLGGEQDSISTRKFVAYLFSHESLKPISTGMPKDASKVDSCALIRNGQSDGEVQIYDDSANGPNNIEIVFLKVGNKNYTYRASIKVWGASVALINETDKTSNPYLNSPSPFHCQNHCNTADLKIDTYDDSAGRFSFGMDEMGRFFLMSEQGKSQDKWLLHCGPSTVH